MTIRAHILSPSYEVPEGVRKPNVESSSFIEPIAKRPDGLRQMFKPAEGREKRAREPADDGDLERQTPPPSTSTLRTVPPTPSSSKKLRLTSPIPSPRKVPITPSKPIRVTQVNARESPSPVEVNSGSSSAGSLSRGRDSDAEMNDLEYVAGSSEDGGGEEQVLPTSGNAEAGPSTRKGKERERKGRGRGIEQSKYFS